MTRKKPIAEENPFFKWILIANAGVFVLMVGLMLFAVMQESNPATDMQKAMFEVGRNVATLVAGTFAGLAGAKTGRADHYAASLPNTPRT